VLGAPCFVASVIAGLQANAWSQAMQHAEAAWHDALFTHHARAATAHAAYLAATAACHEAILRMYLLVVAGFLTLFTTPGLLYVIDPSLLGGPFGSLLRRAAAQMRPRRHQRRHRVSFYQGLGLMVFGTGFAVVLSLLAVVQLFGALRPIIPAMVLLPLAMICSLPLVGEGAWWYSYGGRAAHA
jgi:hypothetical protein